MILFFVGKKKVITLTLFQFGNTVTLDCYTDLRLNSDIRKLFLLVKIVLKDQNIWIVFVVEFIAVLIPRQILGILRNSNTCMCRRYTPCVYNNIAWYPCTVKILNLGRLRE